MDRRRFMEQSLLTTAGITLFPHLLTSCSPAADSLHDFGIIAGLVKDAMKVDHRATMALLADMGYRYLEFGGTYDEDPSDLLAYMKEIGLKPVAGGTSMAGLQGDDLQKQIDSCLALEKSYLVCYWPWMNDEPKTLDTLKWTVEQLNRMGETCKEQGIRFAFHNHDQEFAEVEGEVIYDFFLTHTTADVTMQIDLYWAHKGGADIREYFTRYPGRFELVHVKDSYDSPDRDSFACVGDGILDFENLFSYRKVAGFKHLIVENDKPGDDPIGCARSSIDYLKDLNF